MSKTVPIVLWIMVLVATGGYFLFVKNDGSRDASPKDTLVREQGDVQSKDGRVIVEIPWKHLPDVDRFKFTDQNGNQFDSADLTGKPYVVSFFFARCPTFCRQLNNEIERVNRAVKNLDIQFLTITVEPENDTPEVLKKYAEGYGATPDRWAFLTGPKYVFKQLGEHNFNVVVDRDTHTDNIMLVDKWGRYRDRFKWDQPHDMKRFVEVARQVAAEEEPPLDQTVKTRNVLAGYEHKDLSNLPWVKDFHLTERSGKKFFSRDLVGEVWIANFFFSSCPGICKKQNAYLQDLQKRFDDEVPRIVSISTDPVVDTPEHLRKFADQLQADPQRWLFCTGSELLVRRIGSEYFRADASSDHHSSKLYIVDRWGKVRGSFDWQDAAQEAEMLTLIKRLNAETRPQRPEDPVEIEPVLAGPDDVDEQIEDEQ